jgi:hypothetical protein
MGPLSFAHPAVGQQCPVCREPIAGNDLVTLQILRPASEADAAKALVGLPHMVEAEVIHWRCRDETEDEHPIHGEL